MNKAIKAWLDANVWDGEDRSNSVDWAKFSPNDLQELVEECMADIGPKWVSVDDAMPDCEYEHTEWDHCGGLCNFDGDVSQSVEITDGHSWARGHYKDDGTWTIYDSAHDFLIVDPDKITHWMPMIKLPG